MIIKRIFNKLKLSFKSLLNRVRRHSEEGTKKQVENITNTVKKYPRLYSKKRENIFKKALKNREDNRLN